MTRHHPDECPVFLRHHDAPKWSVRRRIAFICVAAVGFWALTFAFFHVMTGHWK